jgi:mono/diheme cytochrome c family protein
MGTTRQVAIGSFGALVLVFAGICWFLASQPFSARRKPGLIEAFLANRVRSLSIPASVKKRRNPLGSSDVDLTLTKKAFGDQCSVCHAPDGSGETTINRSLSPPAPDFRTPGTQNLSDGEIFYIIKNGVRFTGVPAWDITDDENWRLVFYIKQMGRARGK